MSKTTKTKSKAAARPAIQTREAADAAIEELGRKKRELDRFTADMNDELAELKARFERTADPLKASVKGLETGIQNYCEVNRNALTNGGKTGAHKFPAGVVRWRKTPLKVTLRNVEAVIKAVKDAGLAAIFLRVKEEIDKEAMGKRPDEAAKIKGVTIGGGEQFEIEPFEAKLSGEALAEDAA